MPASDFDIVNLGADDGTLVADVFIESFSDTTWGPYGPGGHLVWTLYPNMTTEQGRLNVYERTQNSPAAKRPGADPSLTVKAVEKSSGEVAGILILNYRDKPEKESITTTPLIARHFSSSEEYQLATKLRDARNEYVWKVAQQLPADQPFISLMLLAVRKKFQARGVGSLLVRYAAQKADELGANMFVHASEVAAAVRTYERSGFKLAVDGPFPSDADEDLKDVVKTRVPLLLRRRNAPPS